MSVDFANGSRATPGRSLAGKPLAGSCVLVPTRMWPYRARPVDATHRSFPGSADLVGNQRDQGLLDAAVICASAVIATTAPDICSRSACRESCGSDRPVACYPSQAAGCGAFAALANPFSSSAFLACAWLQIKVVRQRPSFKRRSPPECRSRDDPRVRLHALQFAQCSAPNVRRSVAPRNGPVRLLGERHVTLGRSYVFFVDLGAAGMRQHLVDAAAAHDISA
jgi:hypothetical protein